MTPMLQHIVDYIEQKDPTHANRLRPFLHQTDAAFVKAAADC